MPIILLTARAEEADRIGGLGIGADDYVVKPFSPGELVARVKAQLRRVRLDTQPPSDGRLRGGEVELDATNRALRVRGEPATLTAKEFDLLHYLMRARGRSLQSRRAARRGLGPQLRRRPGHGHRPHSPPARKDRARPEPAEPSESGLGHGLQVRPIGVKPRAGARGRCRSLVGGTLLLAIVVALVVADRIVRRAAARPGAAGAVHDRLGRRCRWCCGALVIRWAGARIGSVRLRVALASGVGLLVTRGQRADDVGADVPEHPRPDAAAAAAGVRGGHLAGVCLRGRRRC